MKPSKQAKKAILAFLKSNSNTGNRDFSSSTKQQLVEEIVERQQQKGQGGGAVSLSKKHVTKALKKLIRKGRIIEESSSGMVSLSEVATNSTTAVGEMNKQNERGAEEAKVEAATTTNDEVTSLPIAEILRRKHGKQNAIDCGGEANTVIIQQQTKDGKDIIDIDEEIQRLEAELAAADDDESEDDDDESEHDDDIDDEKDGDLAHDNNNRKQVSVGAMHVKEIQSSSSSLKRAEQSDEALVVCLSTVANDRIAPLPTHCLPQSTKRTLKGIDDETGNIPPKKKKIKKQDNTNVSSGLRDAVKEVLSGYVARSSERLPFYCRVCAKQYTNEKEFFNHKSTDFHKMAVEVERKASFCNLCRKQFTSPVQLKEHVASRPHKERLDQVTRWRQLNSSTRAGSQRRGSVQSHRQWC